MFNNSLNSLKEKNLLRALRAVTPSGGVRAVIEGRECTLFCSNDYLGLSGHPRVREAAIRAVEDPPFGSGAAPLVSGYSERHGRLEEELATFKGAEKALLFGSGYLANVGVIPALAGEGDVILSDSLNHASIVDGCRLSRAEVRVYGHADTSSLKALLKESAGSNRRFIVTEGVFGMDGDIAPLPEITALADEHGATVILDDAHATGTVGATGRGSLEHFGLPVGDIVVVGTLGKALGSYGAFVAARRDTIDWLVNSVRSFMFSTALPPSVCAAASEALKVLEEEPERLLRLKENADMLRHSLRGMGLPVLGEGAPIIPVVMGGAEKAVRLSSALFEAGFYCPAIRPPTVPAGTSRLRLTVSALHAEEDMEGLARAIGRLI